jgi:hypothetical protein
MATAVLLDGPPTFDPSSIELTAQDWDRHTAFCAADPAYFVDNFGVIDKPKSPGLDSGDNADELDKVGGTERGTVRFRLWPAQVGLMGTIVTERLVAILKARQLGISWLVCAYALWLCLFHPNQAIYLFSRRQKDADELIRRIKALYMRLPAQLRDRLPKISGKDNVREINWANGSRIESMPDTRDSGVGNTASLVVLDEWARMRYGAILFEQIKPIMESGGQLIILSTANGMANWFHELWTKAIANLSSFRTVFLPWWSRPGRTKGWYAAAARDSNDSNKFKENYPSNPTEAFRASGNVRFDHAWIEAQAPNIRLGLPPTEWPGSLRGIPGLQVFKLPEYGHRYLIPADVAEGKETSNYDAAPVIDVDTWEEVARIHGQWEPDLFAQWLMALGRTYCTLTENRNYPAGSPQRWEELPATVIPERNNHGHAVLVTLKLKGYPAIGLGHDGAPGWETNVKSKPEGIDLLAQALREGLITIHDATTLNEMSVYKKLKNGTTGAEPPFYDDLVMAWSIGLSYLRGQLVRKTGRTLTAMPNPLAGYRG